jgi:hypothetical protein
MIIVGYLRTNGINAHVLGQHTSVGANTFREGYFNARVFVSARDEDEARRLMAEADE